MSPLQKLRAALAAWVWPAPLSDREAKKLAVAVRDYLLATEAEAVAMAALLAPGDPDARMRAYYYGFERTGVGVIDDLLSQIATAGKAYHNTEEWAEPDFNGGPSHEERIQAAAHRAAQAILDAAVATGHREPPVPKPPLGPLPLQETVHAPGSASDTALCGERLGAGQSLGVVVGDLTCSTCTANLAGGTP